MKVYKLISTLSELPGNEEKLCVATLFANDVKGITERIERKSHMDKISAICMLPKKYAWLFDHGGYSLECLELKDDTQNCGAKMD